MFFYFPKRKGVNKMAKFKELRKKLEGIENMSPEGAAIRKTEIRAKEARKLNRKFALKENLGMFIEAPIAVTLASPVAFFGPKAFTKFAEFLSPSLHRKKDLAKRNQLNASKSFIKKTETDRGFYTGELEYDTKGYKESQLHPAARVSAKIAKDKVLASNSVLKALKDAKAKGNKDLVKAAEKLSKDLKFGQYGL